MYRQRIRNDRGQLTTVEYTIREYPKVSDNSDTPIEVEPTQEKPIRENPIQATPIQEEHDQLNTYLQTTQKSKKDLLNIKTSNPYQSYPSSEKKNGYDGIGCDSYDEVKELVYENIE